VFQKTEKREFRLKSGIKIMEYIKKFSATEKVIFGTFVILAIISALALFVRASNLFLVEVPDYGGELREGMVGLPRTINPVLAITDIDKDLSSLVYSGLMKYEKGVLITDIAESYSVSKDGLTYTFKVRPNIYFQDKEKLTAKDIEFTIQKIQNPNLKSPKRADWANVTVKLVSDTEIQFILKQPYSPFLSNTTVGILPKHIWNSISDEQFVYSDNNIKPIGSGPYEITKITKDSNDIPTEYTLETWRKYYGQKPYISTITTKFYPDLDNVYNSFKAGKIDSMSAVSSTIAKGVSDNYGDQYKIISSPLPRIFGIFINQNQNSVLTDHIVRQALDISLDRKAIIEKIMNGYGTPVHGPLPSTMKDAVTNASSSAWILGNTKDAKILLEKNGWKMGQNGIYTKKTTKTASTTLSFDIYTSDAPDLKLTAEMVKENWKKIGVEINIKTFETGDLYQNVIKNRKYDSLLFGEQIGKDRDLYAFWHSSQRNFPGLNVAMYTNSKVDKVLTDIRETNDEKVRDSGYVELEKLIQGDIPAIFLYSPDFIYIVPDKLKGIEINSIQCQSERFENISEWYLNTQKVWKFFTNNY